jgi:hypothetical protein
MAHGHFEGRKATDSALRAMFTRESLIASEWYRERLRVKQERDTALWQRHSVALQMFRANGLPAGAVDLDFRAAVVRDQLKRVTSPAYLDELMGTLGADPFCRQIQSA